MDPDLLLRCHCWFGGGTEIVLDLGEYRLSKDIDFLCADVAGYRTLRSLAVSRGACALFGAGIREHRAMKADQYGIRGIIAVNNTHLRFEIVREGRISLDGYKDLAWGVPRLSEADRITEKFLANSDRCQDRATSYRDAIDLGMLAHYRGHFPPSALAKAELAYGADIMRKLDWVVARLSDAAERRHAATSLGMDPSLVDVAVTALAKEVGEIQP
jgi:hypothetical protein